MLSREQARDGETKYYDYSADGEREGQASAAAGSSEPSKYRTYSKDANGSVTELEDEQGSDRDAAGKRNEYVYDPYGELDRAGEAEGEGGEEAKLGEEAKDNPFRYEGFYYDSGVKTYDMGARQYRPEAGRFLSQDRYESARGDLELQADPLTQNRYAFAGGEPHHVRRDRRAHQ
jgi:RHS repeat-associated protein